VKIIFCNLIFRRKVLPLQQKSLMRSITVNLPEMSDLSEFDIRMMLASKLYEQRKLSLGHAAEVANLSKRTFAELLGVYGVSLFNYSEEDLAHDIATINAYV